MVNIIFGLIIYFCLMTTNGNFTTNQIDSLIPDYGAQIAGIKVNDRILKINNKKMRGKEDINETIQKSNGNVVSVLIERNGEKIEYEVKPNAIKYKETGIYLENESSTEIIGIEPNSPAEHEGLEIKDKIIKVNGQDVENNTSKLISIINNNEDEKVNFTINRKGQQKEIIINTTEKNIYYLGINLKQADDTVLNRIYYASNKTLDFASSIVQNLKKLLTGEVSKNQLMGPVGISSVVSNTDGIRNYIYILALISLSLGVTNLLPFPPLDGGKVVILLIELIRKKPLKEKTEMTLQTLGFTMLIVLSIYITYNDILRIL